MATELRPGVFTRIFAEASAEAVRRARRVTEALAQVVETQAKLNASTGGHPYGTPTPASPGAGPARISGTLVRSVTHTPVVFTGGGWTSLIGPAPGFFPPYGTRRADSALYGFYLETGDHGITYPWLRPAAEWAARGPAVTVPRVIFGGPWPVYA